MNFKEFLKDNLVVLDGGTGAILQSKGLKPGESAVLWNVTHPDAIVDMQKTFYDIGSNVVYANTFGADCLHFEHDELEKLVRAAIRNAKKARELSTGTQEKFVALDIGPCGKLLKPYGDLDFEDCIAVFAEVVKIAADEGVDLVAIETMNDIYETKAAVIAVKENCDLPFIVTNAYSEDGKLMTGASPEAMVAMLEGLGACALGANCSLGPDLLAPVVRRLLAASSIPVVLKPNAGLPKLVDGKTVYNITVDEFVDVCANLIDEGVRVCGGCCGTTPEYIKGIVNAIAGKTPKALTKKYNTICASYTHAVEFDEVPILIGERINPTGKKRFKQALVEHDISYILNEGLNQADKGVQMLDVNVGLPEIDEVATLKEVVCELQAVTDLPLQIDTSDPVAMEKALRAYNGKPLINSVNGKQESMHAFFPLQKKYGGVMICLTLDENGIPETAEGRLEIARKIIATAKEYGIEKHDLIFDPLALTISADQTSAKTTLEAVRLITEELGCKTSLGVSNISFGLPNREAINSTFFALALQSGLKAAIMNPYSVGMMSAYKSFLALNALDPNCAGYIEFATTLAELNLTQTATLATASKAKASASNILDDGDLRTSLKHAILRGLQKEAGEITKELLKTVAPLDIVQEDVIPALDEVGQGFEKKTIFLPQLLMSAESAKAAFEEVKFAINSTTGGSSSNGKTVVVATVKGDIHDIGKNIAKLLLENYGFNVIDLGKDVAPETIVDCAITNKAHMVGLSALMTTTVPAMEETIVLLKKRAPEIKVLVAGAVLNREYAEKINADYYAKDAMETVRLASK